MKDILKKKSSNISLKFVLLIPVINGIATLTVNYFPAYSINPGTIRAFIIATFVFFFIIQKYPRNRINNSILGFMVYLLILVAISSNFFVSFYQCTKLFIAFFMFPVAEYYFKDQQDLLKLNRNIIITLFLFVVNIIISNIFNIGTSDYLDETVYFGASRVNIAKPVAILMLTTPLFFLYFNFKSSFLKYFSIIVVFGSLLIIVLAVKRSALLAIILGFFIYLILSPYNFKKVKFAIIIGIIALITSSLFYKVMVDRFEARQARFELSDPEFKNHENRGRELDMVIHDFASRRNILQILFGAQLFNDREYYSTRRMLHTDYMIILSGAGIFGILWFYSIYLQIIVRVRYHAKIVNTRFSKELLGISYALVVASLMLSIGGSIYTVDILSLLFLYLGATAGVLKTLILSGTKNGFVK
jgi:hypothetical protein